MTSLKPTKGFLLIAKPSIIGDMAFNRSVILLVEENPHGFIGFVLNKPTEYRLGDLVPEIDSGLKVYNGGPVEQDNLYFIHQVPEMIPGSIEISDGVYWGGDFQVITSLLQKKAIGENDIRFFLGYSGWEANQLEDELTMQDSWLVVENQYKNKLIAKPYGSFWKEKMLELGGDYSVWSNAPENPNLN